VLSCHFWASSWLKIWIISGMSDDWYLKIINWKNWVCPPYVTIVNSKLQKICTYSTQCTLWQRRPTLYYALFYILPYRFWKRFHLSIFIILHRHIHYTLENLYAEKQGDLPFIKCIFGSPNSLPINMYIFHPVTYHEDVTPNARQNHEKNIGFFPNFLKRGVLAHLDKNIFILRKNLFFFSKLSYDFCQCSKNRPSITWQYIAM